MKTCLMVVAGFAAFAIPLIAMQGTAFARVDPSNEQNPNAGTNGEVRVCSDPNDDCSQFIDKYINPAVTLFTVLIGVGAAISIVISGIQYSASADDPSAVSKAKSRIFKTVLLLVGYVFLYAFMQYLIPGGVLGTVVV